MSELFSQLLSASPAHIALALLAVVLLWLLVLLAPVVRLEAKAWFLKRRGVSPDKLADWALDEAKKDRPSPIVEMIEAVRNKPDTGSS